MSIIAWIILGAIAGYLAGFLVKGDESMGVIGHIVLGIVGALIGGFLAGVLFGTDPIDGVLDISTIVTATIGAVIAVVAWNALTGRTRTGRRPISHITGRTPIGCGGRPAIRGRSLTPRDNGQEGNRVPNHRDDRRRRSRSRRL